ncbi:4'-phosphopantetheinyl transferase superfamily protein [Mesorhizobium sp. M2D.F.Ca.ET.185.01.1.1]|uniref:4'-phosphopantetheinyl transferase family protein n=1 Tax=unclassified Mesorhizobium TaxID=325217 RepID=UPI000FCB15F5|nr:MULTISPECIES: 4'-phosphopantetheinyl transferase superfamily protein [unclassified Mesorhizobium]TGP81966.1 4'-phosphopantetheinyl transferase superfamily protein [bacterium M00.F.Ca.ET.227.01.1.1]TGP92142.1 4'-phosphopantetheinyl transferase superfamily protein [bacterium M00.F.Ca.ET.221.01.1.1]TGP95073.1 4'-phosphopantetheinyl transferase superfamily protein [bacterium M00.F.Ca.ET.222.01.1.1]TGT69742.1 4'-phosphopantetheinyl transferase superfamily protein [bacterium M00.F.Ca.ET.159.01.1.1
MSTRPQGTSAGIERAVEQALAGLAPSCLVVGCRRIQAGDEQYLLPEENASMATREPGARAATGAGRHIAHELLRRLECREPAILRGQSGNPVWPAGIVGSIAHDDEMAVAVAARSDALKSVGVDIEPALPLPHDLRAVVAAPEDRLGDLDPNLGDRILFAVKEAAYKASFPLDGRVLGFEDIAVDFEKGEAVTSFGQRLTVRFAASPHILAIAYTASER